MRGLGIVRLIRRGFYKKFLGKIKFIGGIIFCKKFFKNLKYDEWANPLQQAPPLIFEIETPPPSISNTNFLGADIINL